MFEIKSLKSVSIGLEASMSKNIHRTKTWKKS